MHRAANGQPAQELVPEGRLHIRRASEIAVPLGAPGDAEEQLVGGRQLEIDVTRDVVARRVGLVFRPEAGEDLRKGRRGASGVRPIQNVEGPDAEGVFIAALELEVVTAELGADRDVQETDSRTELARDVPVERHSD